MAKMTFDEAWKLLCSKVSSGSPLLTVSRTALKQVLAPVGLTDEQWETIFKKTDLSGETGTIHMGSMAIVLKEVIG